MPKKNAAIGRVFLFSPFARSTRLGWWASVAREDRPRPRVVLQRARAVCLGGRRWVVVQVDFAGRLLGAQARVKVVPGRACSGIEGADVDGRTTSAQMSGANGNPLRPRQFTCALQGSDIVHTCQSCQGCRGMSCSLHHGRPQKLAVEVEPAPDRHSAVRPSVRRASCTMASPGA